MGAGHSIDGEGETDGIGRLQSNLGSGISGQKHSKRRFSISRWKSRQLQSQIFAVVRHAERADSLYSFYQGQRWTNTADFQRYPFDPPLSDAGLEAAHCTTGAAIREFAQQNGTQVHVVVTSPYFRCVQTAVEICRSLGKVRLIVDRALGEVYGPAVMGEEQPVSPVRPMDHIIAYCRARNVRCISKVIGEWPIWPEDLKGARRRYATRFLTSLHRGTMTKRNFVLVTHGDAVGAALSLMPSQVGQTVRKIDFGGMFLSSRKTWESQASGAGGASNLSNAMVGAPNGSKIPSKTVVPVTGPEDDEAEAAFEAEEIDSPLFLKRLGAVDADNAWSSGGGQGKPQVAHKGRAVQEFLPLEPPKASDGWQVTTHEITLAAKQGTKTAAIFTRKVTSLLVNTKFSKAQVEQLLGEMVSEPLGGAPHGEDILRPNGNSMLLPPTMLSGASLSTFMFGMSDFGTHSEIADFSEAGSEFGDALINTAHSLDGVMPDLGPPGRLGSNRPNRQKKKSHTLEEISVNPGAGYSHQRSSTAVIFEEDAANMARALYSSEEDGANVQHGQLHCQIDETLDVGSIGSRGKRSFVSGSCNVSSDDLSQFRTLSHCSSQAESPRFTPNFLSKARNLFSGSFKQIAPQLISIHENNAPGSTNSEGAAGSEIGLNERNKRACNDNQDIMALLGGLASQNRGKASGSSNDNPSATSLEQVGGSSSSRFEPASPKTSAAPPKETSTAEAPSAKGTPALNLENSMLLRRRSRAGSTDSEAAAATAAKASAEQAEAPSAQGTPALNLENSMLMRRRSRAGSTDSEAAAATAAKASAQQESSAAEAPSAQGAPALNLENSMLMRRRSRAGSTSSEAAAATAADAAAQAPTRAEPTPSQHTPALKLENSMLLRRRSGAQSTVPDAAAATVADAAAQQEPTTPSPKEARSPALNLENSMLMRRRSRAQTTAADAARASAASDAADEGDSTSQLKTDNPMFVRSENRARTSGAVVAGRVAPPPSPLPGDRDKSFDEQDEKEQKESKAGAEPSSVQLKSMENSKLMRRRSSSSSALTAAAPQVPTNLAAVAAAAARAHTGEATPVGLAGLHEALLSHLRKAEGALAEVADEEGQRTGLRHEEREVKTPPFSVDSGHEGRGDDGGGGGGGSAPTSPKRSNFAAKRQSALGRAAEAEQGCAEQCRPAASQPGEGQGGAVVPKLNITAALQNFGKSGEQPASASDDALAQGPGAMLRRRRSNSSGAIVPALDLGKAAAKQSSSPSGAKESLPRKPDRSEKPDKPRRSSSGVRLHAEKPREEFSSLGAHEAPAPEPQLQVGALRTRRSSSKARLESAAPVALPPAENPWKSSFSAQASPAVGESEKPSRRSSSRAGVNGAESEPRVERPGKSSVPLEAPQVSPVSGEAERRPRRSSSKAGVGGAESQPPGSSSLPLEAPQGSPVSGEVERRPRRSSSKAGVAGGESEPQNEAGAERPRRSSSKTQSQAGADKAKAAPEKLRRSSSGAGLVASVAAPAETKSATEKLKRSSSGARIAGPPAAAGVGDLLAKVSAPEKLRRSPSGAGTGASAAPAPSDFAAARALPDIFVRPSPDGAGAVEEKQRAGTTQKKITPSLSSLLFGSSGSAAGKSIDARFTPGLGTPSASCDAKRGSASFTFAQLLSPTPIVPTGAPAPDASPIAGELLAVEFSRLEKLSGRPCSSADNNRMNSPQPTCIGASERPALPSQFVGLDLGFSRGGLKHSALPGAAKAPTVAAASVGATAMAPSLSAGSGKPEAAAGRRSATSDSSPPQSRPDRPAARADSHFRVAAKAVVMTGEAPKNCERTFTLS